MKKTTIILLIILFSINSFSQILKPGFQKEEYIELLKVMILSNVNDLKK